MKTLNDLKQYLKDTAIQIKACKCLIKGKVDFTTTEKMKEYWILSYNIQKIRKAFRHHLIGYCELRGMARDRVEKPAQNNLPRQEDIDAVKAEYVNTWRAEAVCNSAA